MERTLLHKRDDVGKAIQVQQIAHERAHEGIIKVVLGVVLQIARYGLVAFAGLQT